MAWILDDDGSPGDEYFPAERDRPYQHAHAICDGRRWLPAAAAHTETRAIWNTVARHSHFVRLLRAVRTQITDTAHHRLCMAADCEHGDDRARGMETSTYRASSAPAISHSLGTPRAGVRGGRSNLDGGRGLARQRPLDRKSTRLNSSHLGISYA